MCGLAAAGIGLGVIGGLFSGLQQRSTSRYNAAVEKQNAGIAAARGADEERMQRDQAAQSLGQSRAAIGSSGVTLSGSPLDLLTRASGNAELDAQKIRYNTQLEVNQHNSQAKIFKKEGKNALISSVIGAGTSLLTGISGLNSPSGKGLAPDTGFGGYLNPLASAGASFGINAARTATNKYKKGYY
jgi:hypothetical protein